jgi:hypothetical protein
MLEALGLSQTCDKVLALDTLFLTVDPGEVSCLLGANLPVMRRYWVAG